MIIAILTDGMENGSECYSMADINQRITHQTEKYGWEVLFLGANQDAIATAARLGIHAHQSAMMSPQRRMISPPTVSVFDEATGPVPVDLKGR